MRYPYRCPSCSHEFDVIKSVSEIDSLEACPLCNNIADRIIVAGASFYGEKDWNNQQWCSALGCYVKSNKHRAQIAKERGLIEVGNEPPAKIHEAAERQREETAERNYNEAMKDIRLC